MFIHKFCFILLLSLGLSACSATPIPMTGANKKSPAVTYENPAYFFPNGQKPVAAYKMADLGLCKIAFNTSVSKWNQARPSYVGEALKRGLDCESLLEADGTTQQTAQVSPRVKRVTKTAAAGDIAVIIGVSDYKRNGHDIPNVTPALNDARAFRQYAQSHLGISKDNIIYIENARSSDLERTFGNERTHKGDAFNWVRPNKSKLYVYFAGHGAPGGDSDAYLVPSDARANSIELNGYPLSTLYKNLGMIPSKETTVILEACFSGNSAAGTVISNASPVYLNAREASIPKNITVITAGASNQLASWRKDRRNSLFTYHYLKGMQGAADGEGYGNGDGEVSSGEIKAYLDDTVTYYARREYGRDQNVQITLAE